MDTIKRKWNMKNSAIMKLTILGVILFMVFASIIYLFVERFSDHLVELRKNELKHLVQIGYNSITDTIEDYEMGRITFDDARVKVRDIIRQKVYEDRENMNYLFMSSYDGMMMVQPFQPEKEGTSQWDLKDSNGVYLIRELVKAAKSESGDGYVIYHYPPPGKEEGEEKISYVIGLDSLKMYLGTGIYSSDINAAVNDQIIIIISIVTIMFVLLVLFIIYVIKPLLSGYDDMKNLFIEVKDSPYTIPDIPYDKYRKGSETFNLLKTFENMVVERYENNLKLKVSETKYRNLLEAMRDGYVMVNTDGKILEFNQAFEEMTGYSKEELLTMTFFDITPKKWHDYETDILDDNFFKRGYSEIYEKEYIKKDGRVFPVELRAYVIDNYQDYGVAMWAIVKDITVRKKYENTLKVSNRMLEEKVAERTSELNKTIEDLKLAQKKLMVSEKNSLIGKLVSGVAHEINTPVGVGLTAVTNLKKKTDGVLSSLESGALGKKEFVEYLSLAEKSCEMIEDNLNISRNIVDSFKKIYVNQNVHEKKLINVGKYIGEVLDSLKYKIDQEGVKLNYTYEDVYSQVYLDDLTQIVSNLLLNSLNHGFGKDRTGEININIYKRENRCIIKFGDDGKGISRDYLESIFEPFFSTTKNKGGMGLGLNIVKNIVNQSMKGEVSVKSEADMYTEFTIEFPIEE